LYLPFYLATKLNFFKQEFIMKKTLTSLVTTLVLPFASTAIAGAGDSCHFHGNVAVKEAVVLDCAQKKITSLAAQARIEKSWTSAKLLKAEIVTIKNKQEWKLAFSNTAASDAGKKTLYTFFNLNGNFLAANFTGE
jgi:hypothetical protein